MKRNEKQKRFDLAAGIQRFNILIIIELLMLKAPFHIKHIYF
jgi:hypothetical protein